MSARVTLPWSPWHTLVTKPGCQGRPPAGLTSTMFSHTSHLRIPTGRVKGHHKPWAEISEFFPFWVEVLLPPKVATMLVSHPVWHLCNAPHEPINIQHRGSPHPARVLCLPSLRRESRATWPEGKPKCALPLSLSDPSPSPAICWVFGGPSVPPSRSTHSR